MSTNLERITEHNTRLSSLKEVAANLPEVGSGSTGPETYDLIIESDGIAKVKTILYTAYSNNKYEFHLDSCLKSSYPLTLKNVILKTGIDWGLSGGGSGVRVEIKSDIQFTYKNDYYYYPDGPVYGTLTEGILPLTSENGQIVIKLWDDD